MTEKRKLRLPKWLVQITLSGAVLAAGVLAGLKLVDLRRKPAAEKQVPLGPLVTVSTVEAKDIQLSVHGQGTVQPRIRVDLVPEVAGRVTWVHAALVDGGFFEANEKLLEIETVDYDLAVDRAKAAVQRAEVALDLERAEGEVAKAEWETLHPGKEPPSPLVIRVPQTKRAEAELQAAKADLEKAEHDRRRTALSLPFNGRILSERVDPGQYVTPGQSVATAYGTDVAEIYVPLTAEELEWLDVPTRGLGPAGTSGSGVPTLVYTKTPTAGPVWRGRAVRTTGQVDPKSRMVTVVVVVEAPFTSSAVRPDLVPGMFVHVRFTGKSLTNAIALPRHALRADDRVWVVEEQRLRIRSVTVWRKDRTNAYVSPELGSKVTVVTSSLDTVTDGMLVRTHEAPREPVGQAPPLGNGAKDRE